MDAYRNPDLGMFERIEDLIGRMTVEEKVMQLMNDAPGIERIGLPAYNYWNEALHGVARMGLATVFPQAICLAATFDVDLMHRVATAISDEGRCKYAAAQREGTSTWYAGLTYWSPNINIFRDPRWGRGHETYGEDPYLTSHMGVAFIKGIQGDKPIYLKASACAKHYGVHNGPEKGRFTFDARCSDKEMEETYFPAFKAAVQEAQVENVMGAYNRLNGVPCCANSYLLQEVLRERWGFQGHVVSDCGAIRIIHTEHKWTQRPQESAAKALEAGCDLNCGGGYIYLRDAVAEGLITEQDLDRALERVLQVRFKLGMFDPPERVPWSGMPESVVDSPEHRRLALETASKSIVLLRNNGILPLDRAKFKSIIILGPTGARQDVLLGNYYGLNPRMVTPVEGIIAKVPAGIKVHYKIGCTLAGPAPLSLASAGHYARSNDLVIATMGLAPELEGEEGDANASGDPDRSDIGLPASQQAFLEALAEVGTPVVLVLTGGSALAITWAQQYVDAIIWLGYPGEEGGTALGNILFGDTNPSGRLPVTWYKSTHDLPPFEDYAMDDRTYRFFGGEPLYPFGFGLSYTRFAYDDTKLSSSVSAGKAQIVEATVTNVGERSGEEVAQCYLSDLQSSVRVPLSQLCGIRRVALRPGESAPVRFRIDPEMMTVVDEDGARRFEPGAFRVTVGGCSPGARGIDLGAAQPVSAEFSMV